jgi:hypothetical protein
MLPGTEKALFGALLQDMLYGNGVLGCAVPTPAHAERLAEFLATDKGRCVVELTLVCVMSCLLVLLRRAGAGIIYLFIY